MTNNNKQPKTPGERFLSWAKAVSVIVATCIAVYAAFKGNEAKDDVDSTWIALKEKVDKQSEVINKQSETIEKLTRRMVFFQGHQSGFSAGQLYEQKASLEKELAELNAKRVSRSATRDEIAAILRGQKIRKSPKSAVKPSAGDEQTFQKIQPLPFRPGVK